MKRLRLRIIVPIMLLHLVAIPLLVYQFLLHFQQPIWEVQKSLGWSLLHEVRDQIAILRMSSRGDPHQVQTTIDLMARKHGFPNLRIYNSDKVLRATYGDLIQKAPEGEDMTTIILTPSREVMELTQWVSNEKPCQPCHGVEKVYIGVLEASIPVSALAKRLGSERRQAIALTMGVLIVVFSLIYIFHHYFVVSPVNAIKNAMQKVKQGDLSVLVKPERNDELGNIAESFNDVVQSLRQAKMELEK